MAESQVPVLTFVMLARFARVPLTRFAGAAAAQPGANGAAPCAGSARVTAGTRYTRNGRKRKRKRKRERINAAAQLHIGFHAREARAPGAKHRAR